MSKVENKHITIKVTGREDHLTKFIQLCKTMQYLGSLGSSRTVQVWFDGDGSARLNFDYTDTDARDVSILGDNPLEEYRIDFD